MNFQGHYNEKSWKKIESLTEEEILDTINHKNVSGIFLKDFNFSELLGDIKYDEHGKIIGELKTIRLVKDSYDTGSKCHLISYGSQLCNRLAQSKIS